MNIPARIIRGISLWWFKRCQRARLDPKSRERITAIDMARRGHRPVEHIIAAQQQDMRARLAKETGWEARNG